MSLRLVKTEVVPLQLELALEYRDMRPVPGEREVSVSRAKEHMRLLARNKFFTPYWGKCQLEDAWYRGNGNHTSNVLAICLQAHNGGLDERAQEFFDRFLRPRGGRWTGDVADIPKIDPSRIKVCTEEFEAESARDLVDLFDRYDCSVSVRSARDILSCHLGQDSDLREYKPITVSKVLAGVLRSARVRSVDFGLPESFHMPSPRERGLMLAYPKVRETVKWVIENVGDADLYKNPIGAQLLADIYIETPELACDVIEELSRQIENEEDPGMRYWQALTKIRNRPTPESVLAKGRMAVKQILRSVSLVAN